MSRYRHVVLAMLCLACAGMPLAQTTKSLDVRTFEILNVDGNRLVVRDQNGTQEYTVPDDFSFTLDGKPVSVHDLRPGMKGTATVTTTVTSKPVVVTELKEGMVLRASELSITVREGDKVNRYTQAQFDARGVQLYRNGRPIQMADLRRGDALTALIVSEKPPVTLTQQEIQAVLDEDKANAAPAQVAAAGQAALPGPSVTAAAVPASPAAAPPATPAPVTPSATGGLGMFWWLLIALVVLATLYFLLRRRG